MTQEQVMRTRIQQKQVFNKKQEKQTPTTQEKLTRPMTS